MDHERLGIVMAGFPVLTFEQVGVFLLIFLRIGAIFVMLPIFGER